MYLARRHTRYSLEEIGGYFGGRDHTTVLHAVRTDRRATCKDDPEIAEQLNAPGSAADERIVARVSRKTCHPEKRSDEGSRSRTVLDSEIPRFARDDTVGDRRT